ncbi:MAG TPA: trypsin-like serine protease [Thermoanaerobaculia bacterium]|nr:trypsin-like serine protease [Thermoanaerobaculia bacterium]
MNVVLALVLAVIMRHDREPARYAALGSHYPAVGMLGDQVTCTLIAPRWALSAGHTIEDYFNPNGTPFVRFAGKRYDVDKIIIHPKRVLRAVDSDYDLVLLRLKEPAEGIAPVLLYERDDEQDKIATIVGYGETGTGDKNTRNERGNVFAANNKVEAAFEHSLVFTFDTPPAGLELEGLRGAGDSGCPALIEENGKLYTIGVGSFNSGSEATASSYGTIDAFARVSAHRKWITDTMAADPPSTVPLFGTYTKTTTLPDTPAGNAARSLLAAFNSGSIEKMADFYRAYGRRRPDEEIRKTAASWQALIDQYGAYTTLGYKEAGPLAIVVYVRAAKGDLGRAVAVVLEPEGEHRVKRMVMADTEEPKP